MSSSAASSHPPVHRPRSFRRGVLRGLALMLPPVLTVVVFLWMASTVQVYVLQPVTGGARSALVWWLNDTRGPGDFPQPVGATAELNGRQYVRLEEGRQYVPKSVVDSGRSYANEPPPRNAREAYERYVDARFLRPLVVVPLFLVVFVAVLYVLGRLFAARASRLIEAMIGPLPFVRSVYSSAKKMTEFAFVEEQPQYRRVVAIEFPRAGVWTIGLVTGEGLLDIAGAANEPCVTVAVPGSPVPFTGNVVTVPRRAAHDMQMTIDEALQFFISCGVVVPQRDLDEEEADAAGGDGPRAPAGQAEST